MRRINALQISLAALACGLVAIALGIVIVVRGGDDGPNRAVPTTASPSTEATTSATATPPTAEPGQYPQLRVVGDMVFPSDLTMLTTTGGYGHGTGLPWRTRLIVGTLEGPRVIELSPPGDASDTLMGILADPGGGPLYAVVCSGEQCEYEGGVTSASSAIYRSTDGGFRWAKLNERDGRWWPRLAVEGDFVAVNFDGASPAAVFAGSNRALTRPEAYSGLVRYRGEPAWVSQKFPMLEHADGSSLLKFDALPIDARVSEFASDDATGRFIVTWSLSTPNPTSHGFDSRYFITAVGDGGPRTFETRIPVGRLSGPWRDGKWLLEAEVALRPNTCTQDYAKDGDHGLSPAVFDPATGDLAFVGAPYFASGCAEGAETVIETWRATAASVSTPGDCLKMRVGPGTDAKVVDCLPDATIVFRNGPITESDGIRWVAITTLGNEPGWVAEPFLRAP